MLEPPAWCYGAHTIMLHPLGHLFIVTDFCMKQGRHRNWRGGGGGIAHVILKFGAGCRRPV